MLSNEKRVLRSYVRGAYDIQMLRVQTGNRIVAVFREKLGIKPGEKTNKIEDKEATKAIETIMKDYKTVTDGAIKMADLADRKQGLITSKVEYTLATNYYILLQEEEFMFDELEKEVLPTYLIYTDFLKGVKGIGPRMAGVIISEININEAIYASSIWKYAGLDVAEDGKGRSNRKEHQRDIEYINAKGEEDTKKGITYNPFLKSKLIGVLASSFLRAGKKDNPYSKLYYDYKNRMENHKTYKDVVPAHRHAMALRYSVKIFLIDLYKRWRMLEGLPVHNPYAEAKLDRKHHGPSVTDKMGHIIDQSILDRLPHLSA